MQDFRELKVWERARQLALHVYRLSNKFPREELYGLTAQSRRAAVSIAANIAEGRGCGTDRAFARYLKISMGSAYELDCYAILACDLGFITETERERTIEQVGEVRRMIFSFLQTLDHRDVNEG